MAEYTYKDVIIDPEDPRVEVGSEYYVSDSPKDVLCHANNDIYAGTLKGIDAENPIASFIVCCGQHTDTWTCLIRKKETSYAERQTKWIADNNVKKGDRVRVTRKAQSCEDGWQTLWNLDMDEAVGKVGTVCHISANFRECGIEVDVPDVGEFLYPYFVLEKVEQKYVPFDLTKEEDRARLRGAWIRRKANNSVENQIIGLGIPGQVVFLNGVTGIDAKLLLEEYEFNDGTPCGKLVEVAE